MFARTTHTETHQCQQVPNWHCKEINLYPKPASPTPSPLPSHFRRYASQMKPKLDFLHFRSQLQPLDFSSTFLRKTLLCNNKSDSINLASFLFFVLSFHFISLSMPCMSSHSSLSVWYFSSFFHQILFGSY